MSQITSRQTKRVDTTYDHIIKYTGVFGGVQGLRVLASLLKKMLTARFLHSMGMGLADVYANLIENINAATSFGFSFSVVRSMSEIVEESSEAHIRAYARTVRTWCLWTALLAAVICLCGAPYFSHLLFGDSDHTGAIMLLSIALITMPIESGECSLLKAMHCLKRVALVESICCITSLLTTIPLYIWLGIRGVVYSLVLTQLVVTVVHLCFSATLIPYRVRLFSGRIFREGLPLLRLGVPYAIAAAATAFVMGAVFHFIEDHGQIAFYKSAIMILSISSSMVFTTMDVDFFPRLSAVNHNRQLTNHLVSQQIDVCIMLLAPLLLLVLLVLPFIVPILLTSEFMPVVGICAVGLLHTYLRGVSVPVEYVALAKGHSLVYLILEITFSGLLYFAVTWFYPRYALVGLGMAMVSCIAVETLFVILLYGALYGLRLSRHTVFMSFVQLSLLASGVGLFFQLDGWIRLVALIMILAVSALYSFHELGTDSPIVRKLLHRFINNDQCDCC